MVAAVLYRLNRCQSLGVRISRDMREQFPADTSRFVVRTDGDRDFADFHRSIARQHRCRDNFGLAIDEREEVFGLEMIDCGHRNKLVVPDIMQRSEKPEAKVFGRDVSEKFGKSRLVGRCRGTNRKTKACSRRDVAAPILGMHQAQSTIQRGRQSVANPSQIDALAIGSETTQLRFAGRRQRRSGHQMSQQQGEAIGLSVRLAYRSSMFTDISRRRFLMSGAAASLLVSSGAAFAQSLEEGLSPAVAHQALTALADHRSRFAYVDRIGIVDFALPSLAPRLFIVDAATGGWQSHLVAHGSGSDPAHTGWASRFSNEPGSHASSSGAYVTGAEYSGHHGRSMRLAGLDVENGNAESRSIVVHSAWYVTPEIAAETGKLGRSQGCFAVSDASLGAVLDQLGPGRLLFAAKA